jgi:pimeloyl-ACP methyl ester carboxylesterase
MTFKLWADTPTGVHAILIPAGDETERNEEAHVLNLGGYRTSPHRIGALRVSPANILLACLLIASCANTESNRTERMIDIGTHALHIRVMGTGSPTVVIDGGIAARCAEWHRLQARIAETTRVILYDRAGYGASEPGPLPRDSEREMDELKRLLEVSSIEGPYVLVGHSLGALNLQVFAARHPEDVAGMVLLDPPPLGWLLGERYPDLRVTAERMTDDWQAIADAGAESSDPGERAEADFFRMIASEHREMLGESARLASDIETFGDMPLVVIASGAPNPLFGDVAEEYQAYWIDQSRLLAATSDRGEFLLARDSSHRLHEEAADLVLDAILSVTNAARGR